MVTPQVLVLDLQAIGVRADTAQIVTGWHIDAVADGASSKS